MRIESIKLISGVKIDPLEDGAFPLCYLGQDLKDGKDYWIVCDSDNLSVRDIGEYLMSIIKENKDLRKELAEEKSRTNMLNFGQ